VSHYNENDYYLGGVVDANASNKGETMFSYKVLPVEDYASQAPGQSQYLDSYPVYRADTDTSQISTTSYLLPVETFPVDNFTIYEDLGTTSVGIDKSYENVTVDIEDNYYFAGADAVQTSNKKFI